MGLAIFIVLVAIALALAFYFYHRATIASLEAAFETRFHALEIDADNLWARAFPPSAGSAPVAGSSGSTAAAGDQAVQGE